MTSLDSLAGGPSSGESAGEGRVATPSLFHGAALFPAGIAAGTIAAGTIALAIFATAWWVFESAANGREAAFALLSGAAFGVILQRARFCFFCILGDAFDKRDVRPLLGLLLALAVGTVGAAVVFGAWVPDAFMTKLPPAGNIGPIGWPLALGGLLFGLGMAFSGSCVSAHLYRLGEGSLLSPVALFGTALGFLLGFSLWNPIYLAGYVEAPIVWLPNKIGFAGALALQLGLLALIAWGLWRFWHREETTPLNTTVRASKFSIGEALWVKRWPVPISALLVGIVSTFALLRTEPIGVTSGIATAVRRLGSSWNLLPERLEGLDGFRGCRSEVAQGLLHLNALFVAGLVFAAFAAAFAGGHFKPKKEPWRRVPSALVGGVLLGFGSMIALGCTIGRLYSGVTALSLCGWVFGLSTVAGVWIGLKTRRLWW